MDPINNPYVPGAGMRPADLIDRDNELEDWLVQLHRTERGRGARPAVVHGLRGVGKTVLLGEFMMAAEQREWIVGMVEAGVGKDLRELLVDAFQLPLANLARPSASARVKTALRTFTSFRATVTDSGTWSFGLDLDLDPATGANSGILEADLSHLVRDLSTAAAESGVGVALLIDEAQDLASDELQALCALAHHAGQRRWPLLIALAGLPSLPRLLSAAKSYAERLFHYSHLHHLDDDAARLVLTEPAADEGVDWDHDALGLVIDAAGGYPYYLQEFGSTTWLAAEAGPRIDSGAARLGVSEGLRSLDAGFFRARWDRATRAEQAYLRAIAAEGGHTTRTRTVAQRLERTTNSLGPTRDELIKKGLIYAPAHGEVTFTVPKFAEFINRQPG